MDHTKELALQILERKISESCNILKELPDCPEKTALERALEEMRKVAERELQHDSQGDIVTKKSNENGFC